MSQELERSTIQGVVDPNMLNLREVTQIDLTGIPPAQVAELRRLYASGMIDLTKKAQESKIDNASLALLLESFNTEASRATQANVSMTATHTQTTSIGRTEVVIGNTDRAASGKISASATGAPDRTLWIIGIIAGAVILLALVASRH